MSSGTAHLRHCVCRFSRRPSGTEPLIQRSRPEREGGRVSRSDSQVYRLPPAMHMRACAHLRAPRDCRDLLQQEQGTEGYKKARGRLPPAMHNPARIDSDVYKPYTASRYSSRGLTIPDCLPSARPSVRSNAAAGAYNCSTGAKVKYRFTS